EGAHHGRGQPVSPRPQVGGPADEGIQVEPHLPPPHGRSDLGFRVPRGDAPVAFLSRRPLRLFTHFPIEPSSPQVILFPPTLSISPTTRTGGTAMLLRRLSTFARKALGLGHRPARMTRRRPPCPELLEDRCTPSGSPMDAGTQGLAQIDHFVVIYQENW